MRSETALVASLPTTALTRRGTFLQFLRTMNRITALLCLLAAGCAPLSNREASRSGGGDANFTRIANEFIAGYLAWRPGAGTSLGLHQYDGKLTDYSRASIAAELARLKRYEQMLAGLDPKALSPAASFDRRLLQTAINNERFRFEEMDAFHNNPMTYADVVDVNVYIKRNFAPLEERVRSIIAIENQASNAMAAARANLGESLPRPYVETAIQNARGSADFLAKDLVQALKEVKNEALMAEFNAANKRAISEIQGFVEYLEKEKLPKSHQRYALGREKFQKMLREGELIALPPERILEIGLRELRREQEIFADTARKIDPDQKPIEVFKAIQKEHPTAEELIPDTRKNLEAIREFVVRHKIVTLPSEVRVRVEETPQYARATSFASMDTPGPFETKATEAYYYVTPVEKEWPPEQAEEWLTAFNVYTTDVVSIHEAYPGHYAQFLRLNASGASRLEKIFSSYAFVEGWAHYTERMMVDEGFGANELRTQENILKAAKYRLAQSDEALLRLCRLCVSIKTHCEGMPLEAATKFFEENCYYEHKPAHQEALRGTFDPQYCYYSLGKLQILKLRQDYQKQEGAGYSLQKFHDEMLRHGAPPIRLMRESMLKDHTIWDEIF